MDVLARRESFITPKDHKDNFRSKVPGRLINPAKEELGLVSKRLLDKINATLRQKLNVQQWKSMADVVSWFTYVGAVEAPHCDIEEAGLVLLHPLLSPLKSSDFFACMMALSSSTVIFEKCLAKLSASVSSFSLIKG